VKRNFALPAALLRSMFVALSEQTQHLPCYSDSWQIAPDAETGETRTIHVRTREADAMLSIQPHPAA
jgi:hypothetical protein